MMSPMPRPPSGAPSGRPPRTSRAEIVDAARRLIDRDGWERLTIRKLAGEIDASPATVYNHVRDKDDLLVLVLNEEAERVITRPDLPSDPRERLLVVATLMHDLLAERPWVVEIITADDLLADTAFWLVENIVAAGVEAGLERDDAVHLYRHVWYFTAGEILIRSRRGRRRDERDGPTYRDQALSRLDAATHPYLAELGSRWASLTAEDTFEEGLRALVDGTLGRGST